MGLYVDVILPAGVRRGGRAAVRMEALGFSGVWAPETYTDPFVDLVLTCLDTSRVTIGTNLALAFARAPFVTAVNAWQLQELSNGRFVLGLGTQVKGHVERRIGVPWEAPGPKLREHVLAVKELFRAFAAGDTPHFEGRFYRHTLLPPVFRPEPLDVPPPPVWIAAVNEYNLETVGRAADGILVHPLGSLRYLEEIGLPAIERGLQATNRHRNDITLMCPVFLAVGDTPEQREEAATYVRGQLGWYGSTRTYRKVFELHGWPDLPDRLHDLVAAGDLEGVERAIPDEMVATYVVTGTPEDAAAEIRERYQGIAERVFLYNLFALPFAKDDERLRRFLAEVQQ